MLAWVPTLVSTPLLKYIADLVHITTDIPPRFFCCIYRSALWHWGASSFRAGVEVIERFAQTADTGSTSTAFIAPLSGDGDGDVSAHGRVNMRMYIQKAVGAIAELLMELGYGAMSGWACIGPDSKNLHQMSKHTHTSVH